VRRPLLKIMTLGRPAHAESSVGPLLNGDHVHCRVHPRPSSLRRLPERHTLVIERQRPSAVRSPVAAILADRRATRCNGREFSEAAPTVYLRFLCQP
jgi:hypothetical protein